MSVEGKGKGKVTLYRPDRPLGLQEVEAAKSFGQSAHEGGFNDIYTVLLVKCTRRH